jgi:hypothetical protein
MNYTHLFNRIKENCLEGHTENIDQVLAQLSDTVDLPTTRAVDLYLGMVTNKSGIKQIEHYLFNGTRIQRNYCTLFFARRNDWHLVNRAYQLGLIDKIQAYSR